MIARRSPRIVVFAVLALAAAAFAAHAAEPRALARCQDAIELAGRGLVERALGDLSRCAGAVLDCEQSRPGDAACLTAARRSCARAAGWSAGVPADAAAALGGQLRGACGPLALADLLGRDGLAHDAASCAEFGWTTLASLDDLSSCIARQHACRAEQMFTAAVPRAPELLAAGGLDAAAMTCLGGSTIARAIPAATTTRARHAATATCQQALAGATAWYARDVQKALEPCLDGIYRCVAEGSDAACLARARRTCAAQDQRVRGTARGLGTDFVAAVEKACGADRRGTPKVPLATLLAPEGLGFAARASRCAELGVATLASLEDIARCVAAEGTCRTAEILARQVPRFDDLLTTGGLDPAKFDCPAEKPASTCGNSVLEAEEQCDPPGTAADCPSGQRCSNACACAASGPPVLDLDATAVTAHEGETVTVGLAAHDPDGQAVVISGAPRLSGATLTTMAGVSATGSFAFSAAAGQAGLYTVTFTARDTDGLTDTKTLLVTVTPTNHPPDLAVQATALVDEGAVLTLPVSGSDPDGDVLTFGVTPDPLPAGMIFVPATGTLTFTPDYTQSGDYDVTFRASDGVLQSPARTCRITVRDVPATDPGTTSGLTLTVNNPATPTLLATARITGTVNAVSGEPPVPLRSTSGLINGVVPVQAAQGATLDVALSGMTSGTFATHFVDGISSADFGAGITVNALTVTGAAAATANITIDAAATPGTRQIAVVTRDETAVSVLAFRIVAGHAAVRGKVVDAGTDAALADVPVRVEGTAFHAVTGVAGTFTIDGLPAGSYTLVARPANHETVSVPVELRVSETADAGTLAASSLVYDPTSPASASIYSLVGRGLGDITGRVTIDDARKLVEDAMLLVGGTEAGVLDAYGNQLNPQVEGPGLVSLTEHGVTAHAESMARGESVALLDVLYNLSFGLKWSGTPPKVTDWLTALQSLVDAAWRAPNDPASAVPILVFNAGRHMSANAPRIDGATRLTRFQAHLIVDGLMTAAYKNHDTWPTNGTRRAAPPVSPAAPAKPVDGGAAPTYTMSWTTLIANFGVAPEGPAPNPDSALPGFEDLLASYYLDNSPEALQKVKDLLLTQFPGYGLEDLFNENPYGVKNAIDHLTQIAASDVALQTRLNGIFQHGGGADGTEGVIDYVSVTAGPAQDEYFGQQYLPTDVSIAQIVTRSWAPSAPYVVRASETRTTIGPTGAGITVPVARISFYPTGEDHGGGIDATTQYVYRLWRFATEETGDSTSDDAARARGNLVLLGSGRVDADDPRAPKTDPSAPSKRYFDVFLPPTGMNRYRVDVVRLRGSASLIAAFDVNSPAYKNQLRPWLSGYVDNPMFIDPLGRLGRQQLYPGQGWLNGVTFEISALSNPAAVWIGGGGSGLGGFGRVDLAADYDDPTKIYMSVPAFEFDVNSGGSGAIFRYDATTAQLALHSSDGFRRPGQIGLALDPETKNLYTDNAASDDAYGGRIFRYTGARRPDEGTFEPIYPTRAAGEAVPSKLFAGSVNYYSMEINRCHPASVQQLAFGPALTTNLGGELYIADTLSESIRHVPIRMGELLPNVDRFHVVSQPWASNSRNVPAERTPLAFGPLTDMQFDRANSTLYVSQGSTVVRTQGGTDSATSITGGGTFFASAAGVAFCETQGQEYLFVSDTGAGVIYRIPLADLPLTVPDDDAGKLALRAKYMFISGIAHPGQLRVTNAGGALVWVDSGGLRYQPFGFTGRALDVSNNPLVGAVVTIVTPSGTKSATSDAQGYYTFLDTGDEAVIYATVTHPETTYTERITLLGKCNANTRAAPCVLVTAPAEGAATTDAAVTVRGAIYPAAVDYTHVTATLSVTAGGSSTDYPLRFTGTANEFTVSGVALAPGDNALIVRVPATGALEGSSSLTTHVRRVAAAAETQATAGVILDAEGNPRARVVVSIKVNGVEAAQATTDACGYYTKSGLPLGTVTATPVDSATTARRAAVR